MNLTNTIYVLAIGHGSYDLNNKSLNNQTGLDHLNTELVRYSDLHCILFNYQNVIDRTVGLCFYIQWGYG